MNQLTLHIPGSGCSWQEQQYRQTSQNIPQWLGIGLDPKIVVEFQMGKLCIFTLLLSSSYQWTLVEQKYMSGAMLIDLNVCCILPCKEINP